MTGHHRRQTWGGGMSLGDHIDRHGLTCWLCRRDVSTACVSAEGHLWCEPCWRDRRRQLSLWEAS